MYGLKQVVYYHIKHLVAQLGHNLLNGCSYQYILASHSLHKLGINLNPESNLLLCFFRFGTLSILRL